MKPREKIRDFWLEVNGRRDTKIFRFCQQHFFGKVHKSRRICKALFNFIKHPKKETEREREVEKEDEKKSEPREKKNSQRLL